jgi:hypothetical protein
MLPDTVASKVTAAHLSRRAVLYVRQSSLQVGPVRRGAGPIAASWRICQIVEAVM